MELPEEIRNDELTLELIPPPQADWDEIQEFAMTFSGYDYWGSFNACAEIANAKRHDSLTDLRTCLFFEQRRWRHFGMSPDEEAMAYIRQLVAGIRDKVASENSLVPISNYKADLVQRYWDYQQSHFPDWEKFFECPRALDNRPPVFLRKEAWRNLIINPGASQSEIKCLLSLIPEPYRHKWFRSMNSSQALAQSILGNLTINRSLECLEELKDDDGHALLGKAQVSADSFSMEKKIEHLGEPRSTSLDGYFAGRYQIAIECKFTETEVGNCSRPRLEPSASNYKTEFCDGTYTLQIPRKERCSLTKIGVLYWKFIPEIFVWDSDKDIKPCPLNKNYQLVRNILAVGVKLDGTTSIFDSHAVLIYDERNPSFQPGGNGYTAFTETRQALKEPNMLRKCSWQRIIQHMRISNVLPWLTEELRLKYGF